MSNLSAPKRQVMVGGLHLPLGKIPCNKGAQKEIHNMLLHPHPFLLKKVGTMRNQLPHVPSPAPPTISPTLLVLPSLPPSCYCR